MKKIDVDGDKTISFEEYLILITITSINRVDLINFYKKNEITLEELADFIIHKIYANKEIKISNNSKLDSRIVKTNKQKLSDYALKFMYSGFNNKKIININTDFLVYKLNLLSGLLFYEVLLCIK